MIDILKLFLDNSRFLFVFLVDVGHDDVVEVPPVLGLCEPPPHALADEAKAVVQADRAVIGGEHLQFKYKNRFTKMLFPKHISRKGKNIS